MNTTSYDITPANLFKTLVSLVPTRRTIMIWGPPGVGKSDICRQVAAELKAQYMDIRALLLDPVDLRGIPYREDGMTRWAPPAFFPPTDSKEPFLLNLEELPAAPKMVQAALYQLVFDRACGEYTLPENAYIVACGNRMSDRGVSQPMPTPLASKMIHLNLEPSHADWQEWAIGKRHRHGRHRVPVLPSRVPAPIRSHQDPGRTGLPLATNLGIHQRHPEAIPTLQGHARSSPNGH